MSDDHPFLHAAWNNWYHGMGNTHGTWEPGSPKGFRTRHHREHIEGDYKHRPPPGKYAHYQQRSERSLKRPTVYLSSEHREVVCRELVAQLLALNVEVIDACVTKVHFHILARFTPLAIIPQSPGIAMPGLSQKMTVPGLHSKNSLQGGRDPVPRHCLGVAKKHTSLILRAAGDPHPGGIWAVRTKLEPIEDRRHQLHVVQYIRDHIEEGGVVWSMIRDRK